MSTRVIIREAGKMRTVLILATIIQVTILDDVYSFQTSSKQLPSTRALRSITLFGGKSSSEEEFLFGSGDNLDEVRNYPSDDDISNSLERKVRELDLGIGKRYIIRTQQGFLNVHYEPSDPYMLENVVNQLSDGQIVTATGPKRGIWIPHDGGGWSVCKYGGFTWLEPIDE